MGPGISGKAFDLVSFNNYEDTIFRVETQVNGKMKNCLCKKIEVKAGPTDHRMAQNVRDLGLETAKPAMIMSSDNLQTRLNPGWHQYPQLPVLRQQAGQARTFGLY